MEFYVGLLVGGVMEHKEWDIHQTRIIEAEDAEDAEAKYNKLENASYFYGCALLSREDNVVTVHSRHATIEHVDDFTKESIENLELKYTPELIKKNY